METVRTVQSRALMACGDPGVGMTVLPGYLAGRVLDAGWLGGRKPVPAMGQRG